MEKIFEQGHGDHEMEVPDLQEIVPEDGNIKQNPEGVFPLDDLDEFLEEQAEIDHERDKS